MEKNGLIRRSSVARDARLKKLELTEAGQALEAKIHTRVMQMEQRLRESLTEEEITQFLSITDKLGAELTSLGAPESRPVTTRLLRLHLSLRRHHPTGKVDLSPEAEQKTKSMCQNR